MLMRISHYRLATGYLEIEISMKCLNCGCENDITDTRCRFCGYELNCEQIMKTEEIINKANEFVSKVNDVSDSSSVGKIRKFIQYIPLCIISVVAIIFLLIGIGCTISEKYKAKGYSETEGVLVNFKMEESYRDGKRDVYYTGVYEYVVNGQKYMGSPNKLSDADNFKEKVKVKYNPDNPSEYVISSDWYELYIPAIIALGVVIIYLVVLKINSNIRKSKESQVNNKLLSK